MAPEHTLFLKVVKIETQVCECNIAFAAHKKFAQNITDFKSFSKRVGALQVKTKFLNVQLISSTSTKDRDDSVKNVS